MTKQEFQKKLNNQSEGNKFRLIAELLFEIKELLIKKK